MVVKKKIKDLTEEELKRCGWIEKIAYRGNTNWTMYDFKTGSFRRLKNKNPESYEKTDIVMGRKWFALYKEEDAQIILIDIAKLDIGEGQEEAGKEIQEFTSGIVNSNKYIFVVARESTSYFSFVKLAALGEIEVFKDSKAAEDLREMIFRKAPKDADLEEDKKEYQEKLKRLEDRRKETKEERKAMIERYIEELKRTIGEKELRNIIDR